MRYLFLFLGTLLSLSNSFSQVTGTMTDPRDGQVYNTVTIGNQVWMAENLKSTVFPDGSPILLIEDNAAWDTLRSYDKAYCFYDNSTTNRDTYGTLYTWAAAMNGAGSSDASPSGIRGVCPDGWHLPSDAEWTELTDNLGGSGVAGGKLKEAGTAHWASPNTGATNESGFTALPGGFRYLNGSFSNFVLNGYLWSSSEVSTTTAWGRFRRY